MSIFTFIKKHQRFYVFGALALVVYIAIYLYYTRVSYVSGDDSVYNAYETKTPKIRSQPIFNILWYAKPKWISKNERQKKTYQCAYSNCRVHMDIKKYNISDAVLFHHSEMDINPPTKLRNQKWIFSTWESPVQTQKYYRDLKWENKFDWVTSYRRDSDIHSPYGQIVPVNQKVQKNYTQIFNEKKKDVVWLVSHCITPSQRELYVKKMKTIVNVDIFGKCGKDFASGNVQNLSRDYKFYLSFENSLCGDYASEKLFRWYAKDYDIVPVVRGAPDIKEFVPSDAIISTSDFKSPVELASFLKALGSNETLYTKYLKAKHGFMTTRQFNDRYSPLMCKVCEYLNKNVKSQHYSKIENWISKKPCLNAVDL